MRAAAVFTNLLVYCTARMKIHSWNVNGIRAVIKKGTFERYIERFQPDILCLQETKASHEQVEIDLPEYQEHWNSAEKKGYSGTAIFTKVEPLEVHHGLPEYIIERYELTDAYGDTTKEGRVLVLELESVYVATVYTPNAKDDLTRIPMRQNWDPAFLDYMSELNETKPVIFCGDFNVAHTEEDLARPKENEGHKGFTKEERAGFDAMLDRGFVDTFRLFHSGNGHYTWWSQRSNARDRNVGWRIDYIMVAEGLAPVVKRATIHDDVMGSDHCPVSIDISL